MARPRRGTCVVLAAGSRVLLSNSVGHDVGHLLLGDPHLARLEVGCFGWTIGYAGTVDRRPAEPVDPADPAA